MKKIRNIISLLLLIAIVVIVVAFTAKNLGTVEVNYWFDRQYSTSLAWVVFWALLAGVVLGVLGMLGVVLSTKRQLARKRKELKAKEQEILNLRSLPLKDVV